MIRRAFKFRLAPAPEQEEKLWQFAGVTRLIYNLALEQRATWWRQYRAATGRNLNYVSQGREVTALRAEFPWIAEVHSDCQTQALRDLDKAFANFFAGRASFPLPRRRGINDAFRFKAMSIQCRTINRRWSAVRLSKIGWIKFRHTRELAGKLINATVVHDALGWHVSFACEIEHEAPANDNPAVGIDRGVVTSLALSNGEMFSLPDLSALDRRRKRAQRALARCKRGSRRRQKRLRRVARLSARTARVRSHWQHCVSQNIASRFGKVIVEGLAVTNMTASGPGKRGLNRSIMNQGWGAFATKLAYKLEERGGALIKVNPAFTSQECSACGTVDSRSRESQASFVCTSCGFRAHADTNAAINILRRSTASMPVEGCGYAPDEAGTGRMAA